MNQTFSANSRSQRAKSLAWRALALAVLAGLVGCVFHDHDHDHDHDHHDGPPPAYYH
jgi:hypothetical protein